MRLPAFLQNHPHKPRFPVRAVWAKSYVRGMNSNVKLLFWLGWLLMPVVMISPLLSLFLWRRESKAPVREQLRYYRDNNLDWLPLEKRQALRLHAPVAYWAYEWSETLEYEPCLRRYEMRTPPKFEYLTLSKPESYIKSLNESWGIISARTFEERVEQLFLGLHSQRFAYAMHFEKECEQMVQRLADLTHLSEYSIKQTLIGQNGRPPTLLWGFDLWRLLPMTRKAYMSNLISEERAWEVLLKMANWVHGLFPSLDAFYDSYRLGNAYWSNEPESCAERRAWIDNYQKKCDWPIKSLTWPENVQPDYPNYVWDSFKQKNQKEYSDPSYMNEA